MSDAELQAMAARFLDEWNEARGDLNRCNVRRDYLEGENEGLRKSVDALKARVGELERERDALVRDQAEQLSQAVAKLEAAEAREPALREAGESLHTALVNLIFKHPDKSRDDKELSAALNAWASQGAPSKEGT